MKLWPFRAADRDLEPPFELPTAAGRLVISRRLTDAEQAAVLELVEDQDDVHARLAEVTHERDELVAALDWQRPAPNPHVLSTLLEKQWWKAPDGLNTTQQWIRIAETAIDYARGLWPLDPPTRPRCENCSDPTEALSTRRWCVACEVAADPTGRTAWRIPQNVAGSHEKAVLSPADSAGEPAPGDPNITRADRVLLAQLTHLCAYCGAVAKPPLSIRGWCTSCETDDEIDRSEEVALADRAEQLLEDLARAFAAHDEQHTGMPWGGMKDSWRESYRGLAGAVIAAGWRPPLTTGAAS